MASRNRNYNDDEKLAAIHTAMKPLLLFLQRTGKTATIAPNFQILIMWSRFARACLDSGTVSSNLEVMDPVAIARAYGGIQKAYDEETAESDCDEEEKGDECEEDADVISTRGSKKGKRKPFQKGPRTEKKIVVKNLVPETLPDFFTEAVDRGFVMVLHNIPEDNKDPKYQKALVEVCEDLSSTTDWLGNITVDSDVLPRCIEELSAIRLVLLCAAVSHPGPRPSVASVRSALRTVLMACKRNEKPFQSAESLCAFTGAKKAFTFARSFSALGANDAKVDEDFDASTDALEEVLGGALEDIPEWTNLCGDGGEHVSMTTCLNFLHQVFTRCCDFKGCADRWSDRRLEERCRDLFVCCEYLAMLLQLSSWTAMYEIISDLPGLSQLALASPVGKLDVDESAICSHGVPGVAEMDAGCNGDVSGALVTGGSDGQPSSKAITLSRSQLMANLSESAVAKEKKYQDYFETVEKRIEGLAKLLQHVSVKVGPEFNECEDCSDAVKNVDYARQLHAQASMASQRFMDYIKNAAMLYRTPLATVAEAGADVKHGHMKVLSTFCPTHHLMRDGTAFKLDPTPYTESLFNRLQFPVLAKGFGAEVCEQLYTDQVDPAVLTCVQQVEQVVVTHQSVPVQTLQTVRDPATILPRLIADAEFDKLAKHITEAIDTTSSPFSLQALLARLENSSSAKVFKSLQMFFEAVDISSLPVSTMKAVFERPDSRVPSPVALIYLKLVVQIRSIAEAASYIQEHLVKADAEKKIPDAMLFDRLPYVFAVLGQELTNLEAFLDVSNVGELEADWQSPVSCASTRTWTESVAYFNKMSIEILLKHWGKHLSQASSTAQGALPQWMACFGEDTHNAKLSDALLNGKTMNIVKIHNTLHAEIEKVNAAARVVNVSPAVKLHELTSESVSIALHLLESAKRAAVVSEAATIVNTYGNHYLSGTKAVAFLLKHPKDKRDPQVPSILWKQLESMASSGVAYQAKPQAKASASRVPSMFVKKESNVPPQTDPEDSHAGAKQETSETGKEIVEMKAEEITKSEAGAPRGLKKRRKQ